MIASEFVAGDDQFLDVGVATFNEILPDVYEEQEHLENYEFYLHSLDGGVPVPQGDHLTGSIKPPKLKVLTGSLKKPIRLTGSLKHNRRVLTGSVRGANYGKGAGKKR